MYQQKINCTAIFSTSGLGVILIHWASFRPFSKLTQLTHSILLNRYSKECQSALHPFGSLSRSDCEENENCAQRWGCSTPNGPKSPFFHFHRALTENLKCLMRVRKLGILLKTYSNSIKNQFAGKTKKWISTASTPFDFSPLECDSWWKNLKVLQLFSKLAKCLSEWVRDGSTLFPNRVG